ncbi:unnamed protein product [Sphagnum tenellum]
MKRVSISSVMAPGRPPKKAGQPQPESNLVLEFCNGVPHPAHLYTPSSFCLLYYSVPAHLGIQRHSQEKLLISSEPQSTDPDLMKN